jgi:large subunit ribosomal protein L14
MIQVSSLLKVVDKTGITSVKCIKVLSTIKNRIACIGDVIVVSVHRLNPKKFQKVKLFKKKKFLKGTLHRGLIIRSCVNFKRMSSIFLKFNENSVVLVNKRVVPVSNRVYGPVLRELCMRLPSLGCVTRFMI